MTAMVRSIATLPLGAGCRRAMASRGLPAVKIPHGAGTHDLCFTFTGRSSTRCGRSTHDCDDRRATWRGAMGAERESVVSAGASRRLVHAARRIAGSGVRGPHAGRRRGDRPTGALVLHAPCDGEVIAFPASRHAVTLRAAERHGDPDCTSASIRSPCTARASRRALRRRSRAGRHALLRFDLDGVAQRASSLLTPVIVVNEGFVVSGIAAGRPIVAGQLDARHAARWRLSRQRREAAATDAVHHASGPRGVWRTDCMRGPRRASHTPRGSAARADPPSPSPIASRTPAASRR